MFNLFNVYQGKERFIKKPGDYDKVAKYFIRVDSGEHVVIRKYMKFNEFLANVSSIISESLIFLYIIMVRINKFYAHENLMTRIFQFKDIEKNKNSNFIKKFKQQFLYESSINHHQISKMNNKLICIMSVDEAVNHDGRNALRVMRASPTLNDHCVTFCLWMRLRTFG